MNKKIICWGIVFIFLISFGMGKITQSTTDVEFKLSKIYNSNNPDSFDWSKGDYGTISVEAWKKVELSNIPKERVNDIPVNVLESRFSSLSSGQKKSLTRATLAKGKLLEKSDNLVKDFGEKKAKLAIEKKYNRRISSFGKGAMIKNGVLQATSGNKGKATLSHLGYKGYFFEIDNEGNIKLYQLGSVSKNIDIPKKDKVFIITRDLKLNYLGNTVKGDLHFDQGKIFVLSKMKAEINGIKIQSWKLKTEIHFDGKEHSGNYISFGTSKFHAYVDKKERDHFLEMKFKPGNGYFKMDDQDLTSFEIVNGKLTINKRLKFSPEVIVKPNIDGKLLIQLNNGQHQVLFENKRVDYGLKTGVGHLPIEKRPNSIPMVLRFLDKKNNDLLGSKNEKERIIFDKNNNLAIVPEKISPDKVECKTCSLETLKENRIFINYLSAWAKEVGINSYSGDTTKLSLVIDTFKNLPDKLKKEVKGIWVGPKKDWGCSGMKADACARQKDQKIFLSENLEFSTLYHEAVHTYHFSIEKKEKRMAIKFKQKMKKWMFKKDLASVLIDVKNNKIKLKSRAGWRVQLTKKEENELLQLARENKITHYQKDRSSSRAKLIQETFNDKIRRIIGDKLGKNLAPREGSSTSVEWSDKESDARFGCTRAYGCNNVYEYTATFVESIANGFHPSYVEWMDPNSQFYRQKMGKPLFKGSKEKMTPQVAQNWAKRYKDALELLREEGIIEQKDYKKIMVG